MLMLAGLICGFVFGWGLLISGMMQPAKVLAFLDIFGVWDPSLLVVMAAALAVGSAGYAIARPRTPLFAPRNLWPEKGHDRRTACRWRRAVRRRVGPHRALSGP